MGVLESQLSAKFSALSQLSVNFDKSQLLFFWQNAKWFRNHLQIWSNPRTIRTKVEETTISTSLSPFQRKFIFGDILTV